MKDKRKAARETVAANQNVRKNYSTIRQRIKFAIAWLGIHGVLPFALAEYLITRGGLRHE